jgi:hypothetical protein
MDTRTRTLILAAMLAALAASLFLLFTGGEILQRFPGNAQPTDFIKPTTGILGSMRGTATAEAEKATPEPSEEQGTGPRVVVPSLSRHHPSPLKPQAQASPARPWFLILWAVLWTMVLRTNRHLLKMWPVGEERLPDNRPNA